MMLAEIGCARGGTFSSQSSRKKTARVDS